MSSTRRPSRFCCSRQFLKLVMDFTEEPRLPRHRRRLRHERGVIRKAEQVRVKVELFVEFEGAAEPTLARPRAGEVEEKLGPRPQGLLVWAAGRQ